MGSYALHLRRKGHLTRSSRCRPRHAMCLAIDRCKLAHCVNFLPLQDTASRACRPASHQRPSTPEVICGAPQSAHHINKVNCPGRSPSNRWSYLPGHSRAVTKVGIENRRGLWGSRTAQALPTGFSSPVALCGEEGGRFGLRGQCSGLPRRVSARPIT